MNRRKFFRFLAVAPAGAVMTPKEAPALATAWREALDARMFANFPGHIVFNNPLKRCKCGCSMRYVDRHKEQCVWCEATARDLRGGLSINEPPRDA